MLPLLNKIRLVLPIFLLKKANSGCHCFLNNSPRSVFNCV